MVHSARLLRRGARVMVVLAALALSPTGLEAQTTPPAATPAAPATTPAPAPQTPAPAAQTPPASGTPAPGTPAPGTPAPGTPAPGTPAPVPQPPPPAASQPSPPDTSISQTMELQPRPVIQLSGHATWDEGFKTLNDSFNKLADNLGKANVHASGNPLAVFTETDDAGFKFTAMIPIDKAPEGKPDVAPDVSFGLSPGGKIMRFQHRSAYDDIDSTYEAITAYLDEKGLEAKNLFAEEYIHRTKSSDDPALEVDIDVFLK